MGMPIARTNPIQKCGIKRMVYHENPLLESELVTMLEMNHATTSARKIPPKTVVTIDLPKKNDQKFGLPSHKIFSDFSRTLLISFIVVKKIIMKRKKEKYQE